MTRPMIATTTRISTRVNPRSPARVAPASLRFRALEDVIRAERMNATPITNNLNTITRHAEAMTYPGADIARFPPKRHDTTAQSGFTLVEVVVALAILALALGVLLGTIS